ncbi:LUD domain-containing protein [Stieleria sp. JC731]|uniref:LutC/YkgG family protein n=1 Tax=Pirellulaceae TaxID=2691357 RepID=UPI001E602FD4|nr:LUD domain-containing protein [Stieleria sp. JC731]MCC9602562.1 LUD domain-containing protein [Stieleria sp. JC731]
MIQQTPSRRAILDRIKTQPVEGPALPDVDPNIVIAFDDPVAKFQEMLIAVGGQSHVVSSYEAVGKTLQTFDEFASAKHLVSLVPEAVAGTVSTESVRDPLAYATVDWTIAKGEFMVAENGAIWVDGKTLPHRVLLFIAQYLAIVVKKSEIVSNMHQAYERVDGFGGPFGIFVSGPSKTADIEQSLVLGAHGCRKLQVFIVDDK